MTNKKNTPLRVPVTHGLKDIYAMDMHLAYQAACVGQFNVVAFGRMAAAVSVVLSALQQHQTQIPDAVSILSAAVDTLLAVRARGDATDIWEISESERPSVLSGIVMAEHCIGTLDVALLERTAAMLLQTISDEHNNTKQPPAKAGGFELRTESPDTRRLNDAS
jgi:hypothetical protein